MVRIHAISNRRCDAVVDGLRAQFGAILAERIVEAEAADFLWEARVKERYLGQHSSFENDREELARIAIVSLLEGRWRVAMCLVDGEGNAVDLLWEQRFDEGNDAQAAFDCAT